MSAADLIRTRRSVRTFDGNGLPDEMLEMIREYAETVTNPYGIRTAFTFLSSKEQPLKVPVITGTDMFIAGTVRRVPHAEEAFGYAFEKNLLYAWSLGVGSTWIAGTMDRAAFEQAIGLEEGEAMPCISPLGMPSARMSFRETMMRKGVGADKRLASDKLFFEDIYGSPLKTDDPALKEALEMVRLAPSAVNKQPWRAVVRDGRVHFYESPSRGYRSEDGWDLQKIDMGIALCHFEMAAQEAGLQTSFELEEPDIEVPAGIEYIASFVLHKQ